MTGLLIKELMVRGDLRRCLIVAPGNLVEQWQVELKRRFHLTFEIITNDRLEASASGNAFGEGRQETDVSILHLSGREFVEISDEFSHVFRHFCVYLLPRRDILGRPLLFREYT